MPAEAPLFLYIHLPWCVKKCPYCDFNSHEAGTGAMAENRYTDALIRDIEFELPRIERRRLGGIFIGGGTPSLFSADALEKLFKVLRRRLNLAPDLEVTLEANPGTAEAERFQAYREIGINRLSIGVQSFEDAKLSSLGRIHSAADALQAIVMARDAGFENINIDLMFGLPKQSAKQALADLQIACAQPVTHVSWYQLTIEANTVFYKYPPPLPAEDESWDMQSRGQALLADFGYGQYEISAYARQDWQCRHNLNYWQFGDYAGIGAGAHAKITDPVGHRVRRFARHRIPDAYMEKAGSQAAVIEEKIIGRDDLVLEFMMNALRLRRGFSTELFTAGTGLATADIQAQLDMAVARGLLHQGNGRIRPTQKGFSYLNDLLRFLCR